MFIFSNFLFALASVLGIVFTILYWLILIRVVLSWVNPDPYNPIVQILHKTTEPILLPIRKLLPFSLNFGIDLSPLIAFLIIFFLKAFLVKTLVDISVRLG